MAPHMPPSPRMITAPPRSYGCRQIRINPFNSTFGKNRCQTCKKGGIKSKRSHMFFISSPIHVLSFYCIFTPVCLFSLKSSVGILSYDHYTAGQSRPEQSLVLIQAGQRQPHLHCGRQSERLCRDIVLSCVPENVSVLSRISPAKASAPGDAAASRNARPRRRRHPASPFSSTTRSESGKVSFSMR